MNKLIQKLNELKNEDPTDNVDLARNQFLDSLINWYKTVCSKDNATQQNVFYRPFFHIIEQFLITSKCGDMRIVEYHQDWIKKCQESMPEYIICMQGVQDDLERLKTILPIIYNQLFFYLSYWTSECGYHGWDWSKDGDRLKMQKQLTDDLDLEFVKLYAMVLKGLESLGKERMKHQKGEL